MIQEFFIALFKAGLPIGVVSGLLVWWALRNGYLGEVLTGRDVEAGVKRHAKDKQARKQADPVHRKWLSLGGGFYGVVALLTLAHLELGELIDFFRGFEGLQTLANLFSVDTLINLFIETIQNTITALTWPVYWLTEIHSAHIWIWAAVAYGGYWLGRQAAVHHFNSRGE